MLVAFMPLHIFVMMCAFIFIYASRSRSKFKSDLNSNMFANYEMISKIKRFFLFPFWRWAEIPAEAQPSV
jgi:hypothetical protein